MPAPPAPTIRISVSVCVSASFSRSSLEAFPVYRYNAGRAISGAAMPLLLSSPAIPPGGAIPAHYTCDGADISPPLAWSGAPAGTQSFILVLEDPDAPGGVFHHWAIYDIPAGAKGLPAGLGPGRPPAGLAEARNDFGRTGYGGPCPPRGGGAHHYHFRLMAISRPLLDLGPAATVLDVEQAATPYTIASTELVGTYSR
jgi:Raf kinase inhibitor-like YbhB/YbcL family protein